MKQKLFIEWLKKAPFIPDNPLKPLDDMFGTTSLKKWIGCGFDQALSQCFKDENQFMNMEINNLDKHVNFIKYLTMLHELIPSIPKKFEEMLNEGFDFSPKCSRSENCLAETIDHLLSTVLDTKNIFNMKTYLSKNLNARTCSLLSSLLIKAIYHTVSMFKHSKNRWLLDNTLRLFDDYPLSFCDEKSHIFIATVLMCLENPSTEELLMRPETMMKIKIMTEINQEETCPLINKLKMWYEGKKMLAKYPHLWNELSEINQKLQLNEIKIASKLFSNLYNNWKYNMNETIIMSGVLNNLEQLLANQDEHMSDDISTFFKIFIDFKKIDSHQFTWDENPLKKLRESISNHFSYSLNSLELFLACRGNVHSFENHTFKKIEIIIRNIFTALTIGRRLQSIYDSWFNRLNSLDMQHNFKFELFISASHLTKLTEIYKSNNIYIFAKMIKLSCNVFPLKNRVILLNRLMKEKYPCDDPLKSFFVSRNDILGDAKNIFDSNTNNMATRWGFGFNGEFGTAPGMTKEFYSLLSQDLMSPTLTLWQGQNDVDILPNSKSENVKTFTFVGKVIAKAILDGYRLDISLCDEVFRRICEPSNMQYKDNYSTITLAFPVAKKLIHQLMIVKRQKDSIQTDDTLTADQKNDLVGKLAFDGDGSFEDLCVNFTFPGTEIEMMEGGDGVILSPFNIENYLDYLREAKNQMFRSKQLEAIRNGIESVFPSFFDFISSEDLKFALCSEPYRKWRIDDLKSGINITNLVHADVIDYLFDIMTKLSENGQKLFLRFVTSKPSLPPGGWKYMEPKIRIKTLRYANADGVLPITYTCHNYLFIPEYNSQICINTAGMTETFWFKIFNGIHRRQEGVFPCPCVLPSSMPKFRSWPTCPKKVDQCPFD